MLRISEWHSASISITVFHQDHFWGFDFRDCWIEYYCKYSGTLYTVQVPGSKTKHNMLILAPTWLCEDPKRRSHRILRMINESWSPGHDPLLPTPSLSSIHPGLSNMRSDYWSSEDKISFQLSLCKILNFPLTKPLLLFIQHFADSDGGSWTWHTWWMKYISIY